MNDSGHFIRFCGALDSVLEAYLEGVTQEESCLVPATGGNSLSWVLGHVAASRNDILSLLDEPPAWEVGRAAAYVRGADGRSDAFAALPLEETRAVLGRSSAAIRAKLESTTTAALEKPDGERYRGRGPGLPPVPRVVSRGPDRTAAALARKGGGDPLTPAP